ncbi:MAG: acetyl-CoA carboxylase carboxyl transferase subunit alpha, partial [Ignavibacteriales bacterium UTCHB3]
MAKTILDFEKPIIELEEKLAEMKRASDGLEIDGEIAVIETKVRQLKENIYHSLTRWQKVQLARHPDRPYTLDYIYNITDNFVEMHGDRNFGDDKAVVCGLAKIGDFKVMIIGQQKGRDTKSNLYRNFGMPNPEGYRKALRLMKLAEKF